MINIFDLHNDYFTELKNYKQKEKYINKSKKQNVSNILSAVWTSKMDENEAIEKILEAKEFATINGLKFAVEDLHFLNNQNIKRIIDLQPTYTGLTWNYENKLACGALEYGGMTKLGVKVVKRLESNNIQIDTAHLNESSFLTFSNITQRPILCSHTAARSLTDNPRNLKDYQIKIIEESGGLVGICMVSNFLSDEKKVTVSDVARHIDYLVSRFSINIVALGTDFYGTTNLPREIKDYKSLKKLQERLEALGYTESSIEKIFYKNAQRFFENKS